MNDKERDDLLALARLGDRLQRSSEYVEDVRFLRNKCLGLSRQVKPLQDVADAAVELLGAMGKAPIAKEQRAALIAALQRLNSLSGMSRDG